MPRPGWIFDVTISRWAATVDAERRPVGEPVLVAQVKGFVTESVPSEVAQAGTLGASTVAMLHVDLDVDIKEQDIVDVTMPRTGLTRHYRVLGVEDNWKDVRARLGRDIV